MFVVTFSDGSTLHESSDTAWDSVPFREIAEIAIKLPGKDEYVQLDGYSSYYCFKEAISVVLANAPVDVAQQTQVVAQVAGGIDQANGIVDELRVNADGSYEYRTYPLEELTERFIDPQTRIGSFDPSIIRPGI